MRGKMHDAAVRLTGDRAIKIANRFEQHFGALVGIDEHHERTAQFRERERYQQRLSGIRETREAYFAASAPQRFKGFLDDGATCHAREKLADNGKNHAWGCLIRSSRREVEKPGSSGIRTTFPPLERTASSSSKSLSVAVTSPPFTRTSGVRRAMNSTGVDSSYSVT